MTDDELRPDDAEEAIEDLEAPAESQSDIAGGAADIKHCVPTNNCQPVNTVVACNPPTQMCHPPTCHDTVVA